MHSDVHILWFKSYYVVWKPYQSKTHININQCLNRTMQYGNKKKNIGSGKQVGFKSYYVVWKHKERTVFLSLLTEFKSYYVVWKPGAPGEKNDAEKCLNRTMQYGNRNGLRRKFKLVKEFKSYYVVWKL